MIIRYRLQSSTDQGPSSWTGIIRKYVSKRLGASIFGQQLKEKKVSAWFCSHYRQWDDGIAVLKERPVKWHVHPCWEWTMALYSSCPGRSQTEDWSHTYTGTRTERVTVQQGWPLCSETLTILTEGTSLTKSQWITVTFSRNLTGFSLGTFWIFVFFCFFGFFLQKWLQHVNYGFLRVFSVSLSGTGVFCLRVLNYHKGSEQ